MSLKAYIRSDLDLFADVVTELGKVDGVTGMSVSYVYGFGRGGRVESGRSG